jgi:CheY-like chemotaxis protein
MARNGPVIIIEDDVDDEDILKEVLHELGVENKVICFELCENAWRYLKTTSDKPLVIFCDINLPKQSGLSFKKQIDEDEHLRKKSIPFVFYSTTANQQTINEAYTKMTVQGFFTKGNNYKDIKRLVKIILDYWLNCKHPNE